MSHRCWWLVPVVTPKYNRRLLVKVLLIQRLQELSNQVINVLDAGVVRSFHFGLLGKRHRSTQGTEILPEVVRGDAWSDRFEIGIRHPLSRPIARMVAQILSARQHK